MFFITQDQNSKLARSSITNILKNLNSVPEKWRTAIRNNGGGYFNHIIYWASMCPSSHQPKLCIKEMIEKSFGSFDDFKEQFSKQASSVFGSGYTWLVLSKDRKRFHIMSTNDQVQYILDDCTVHTNVVFPYRIAQSLKAITQ